MFEHPANSAAALLQGLQKPMEKDPWWRDLLDDPDLTPSWDMGPPSDPPDISGKSKEDSIELMVDWFRTNFEDPADATPWEGEYVYIWGGPCDAREELEDAFSHVASDELIEAATIEIETDGYEWAPASRRMQPEAPCSDLAAAKQKLMAAFDHSSDGATTARFDMRAVALVLHELYQLQRRLDSVRVALERDKAPGSGW